MLPSRDNELVQIMDAALADATNRALRSDGGSWLACRSGCTACCHGVFRISALDAERLREGLCALEQQDPSRAAAIRMRAASLANELRAFFPGDPVTGKLDPEESGTWDEFADMEQTDGPCPVLDPATGRCELYSARPLTCRIFGPPVQNEAGIGMCELCYVGASEAEILHGEMHLQHHALEEELDKELPAGETVIAWAVL
jgi:Fe-S-cluster containining protein